MFSNGNFKFRFSVLIFFYFCQNYRNDFWELFYYIFFHINTKKRCYNNKANAANSVALSKRNEFIALFFISSARYLSVCIKWYIRALIWQLTDEFAGCCILATLSTFVFSYCFFFFFDRKLFFSSLLSHIFFFADLSSRRYYHHRSNKRPTNVIRKIIHGGIILLMIISLNNIFVSFKSDFTLLAQWCKRYALICCITMFTSSTVRSVGT